MYIALLYLRSHFVSKIIQSEPLTAEAGQRVTTTLQRQRKEQRWTVLGQPELSRKTKNDNRKDKERYYRSGVTSIRAPGITLLIVTQSSGW
jgi:hypothetical protein